MLRSHRVLVLLLAAALASGACGSSSGSTSPVTSGPPSVSPSAAPALGIVPAASSSAWDRIPDIVAHVGPSVVSILRPDAEGSGVVWSQDGVIVTNNHVVDGVKQVVVVFLDGQRSDAEVLATDPLSDLAIVKTQRTGLPAAQFATAIPPQGSLAIAVGNPLGFENSATAGIISGSHRAIPGAAGEAPALVDLIQTDAAISPGNSGGALIGADEQVIGVNVAYIPPSAGSVSIGFAIPAPTVIDVVKQLQANGKAEHPYLGLLAISLTAELIERFDIKATDGALVVAVAKGSPAAAAGIKPGDVIVGLGDAMVHTVEDMLGALRQHKPGETVQVNVDRGGTESVIAVTLGEIAR